MNVVMSMHLASFLIPEMILKVNTKTSGSYGRLHLSAWGRG